MSFSFKSDLVLPDGEIFNSFDEYLLEKTIITDSFSSYIIKITLEEEDIFGEYNIILDLDGSFKTTYGKSEMYKEIIKEKFNLINHAK